MSRLHVFYDGSCGLCHATVAWALARDCNAALIAMPFQSDEARRMLGPHAARAADELHVWSEDHGIRTGSDAIAALLTRLPGWRLAGALLAWPPVRLLARPIYRAVASRRPRRCELPAPR